MGLVHRYLERLGRKPTSPGALDRDVDDATFVNFFGQHLDLDPLERQALLEEASTSSRAARLVDIGGERPAVALFMVHGTLRASRVRVFELGLARDDVAEVSGHVLV